MSTASQNLPVTVIGGYLGAHFAVTRGEGLIRVVLNLVLVAFIIKLLFNF